MATLGGFVRLFLIRELVILVIAIGLAGCGIAQQREQEAALQARRAAVAAAGQQHEAARETCLKTFSEKNSDAVARAKCFNTADEILKPFNRYPDLLNLRIAKRNELAERQAAGKITRAQLVLEGSQLDSQLASEAQRRSNADQSVEAQQQAAWAQQQTAWAQQQAATAAGAPRSCTRTGNTVNCY